MSTEVLYFLIGAGAILALYLVVFVAFKLKDAQGKKAKFDAGKTIAASPKNEISPELIAVITAAICAASGMQASDFTVRGVQRNGFTTPIWGHVNRLNN